MSEKDPCAGCIWSPPSSFGGKPCCHCDPDDPQLNCYQRKEETAQKTNGDRIRQMTDEELAERFKREICKMVSDEECQGENCKACRLAWLRKEANDER